MSRPTIYSIAKQLNLSPSTVSRAFSRPEKVRPEVRERVLKAAAQVAYHPHAAARNLATGRSGLVGVVFPDITNPFFPPLLQGLRRGSQLHSMELMFIDSGDEAGSEERIIGQVRNKVDAIIAASPRMELDALVEASARTPLVCINNAAPGVMSTYCDDDDALFAAVRHLAMLGHGSIALVEGPQESWIAQRRAASVRRATERIGVERVDIGAFPSSFEGGRQAAPAIARSDATAVLAFDDVTACGVIAGLAAMGLWVPRDISVIGCDDVPVASMLTPQLTTLSAPVAKLATSAVELMWSLLEGQEIAEPVIAHRSTLTVRGTTGAARLDR